MLSARHFKTFSSKSGSDWFANAMEMAMADVWRKKKIITMMGKNRKKISSNVTGGWKDFYPVTPKDRIETTFSFHRLYLSCITTGTLEINGDRQKKKKKKTPSVVCQNVGDQHAEERG